MVLSDGAGICLVAFLVFGVWYCLVVFVACLVLSGGFWAMSGGVLLCLYNSHVFWCLVLYDTYFWGSIRYAWWCLEHISFCLVVFGLCLVVS